MKITWVILIGLAALVHFSGCNDPATGINKPTETMNAVATVYPLADVLRQLGGRWIAVEWIIESGGSLDSIRPSRELRDKLRIAEIRAAAGLRQPWAVEGFDDPSLSANILRLDLLEPSKNAPETDQSWLDPEVIKVFAQAAADKMAVQRPERVKDFQANAGQFIEEINAILKEHKARLGPLPGKRVMVLNHDFTALTRRLGIEAVLPIEPADPNRVSDESVRKIRETAKAGNLHWLILDDGLPLGTRDDLAKRTGLKVITLDALGTSSGAGRSSYQAILKFDLEQLELLGNP